jgi:hypothetical protein
MLQAMAGFGPAASDVGFDPAADGWFIRNNLVSEAVLRTWFGAQWTISATLHTTAALAVALILPDTMEFVDYRENEPHADWRRAPLVHWRPNAFWLAVALVLFAIVFARLNQFTEFLYYQF